MTGTSGCWKAVADLAALVGIWVGTLVITFAGIPALVDHGFKIGTSAIGLAPIGSSYSPEDLNAYNHYLTWARIGFVLISVGMFVQGWEPVRTLYHRLSQARLTRRGRHP